ncbi:PA0069 family radical SAM protein [Robiginitalea sp. M366]|uniref:PA0069 family radical SAM protein n=1 Tax=Robiginitalea aestuariiviva TaxID=3036903 RepID=UPI00240D154E|nr:PA0069 family radical SAM protein [Robiginitalea aestuariiviva]MDG1571348.1 PA0069 family radical SAM protein [Robiginitalea aestuariiviva]
MSEIPGHPLKGRGAQSRRQNRFDAQRHEVLQEFLQHCHEEGEALSPRTTHTRIFPKTIVNKVESPDVRMPYSMNPYQGCEHGCVYCYARNSHEFWGLGPGLDFESRILVKETAPTLLEAFLKKPSWKASPIVLSGNTDCYQPLERELRITRACLEVFLKYRHPVGIITKNALVLRDLDLLQELHAHGLVAVHISLTTLNESLRRQLEPRTASAQRRLQTIKALLGAGIPVNAMLAPIIPGLNSAEIPALAKAAAEHGALSFGYTVVRLNGAIADLFAEWLQQTMPERSEKVLSQIRQCHGGQLRDSRFGTRIKGEGPVAEHIRQLAQVARRRYFKGRQMPALNCGLHAAYKSGQYSLF